MQKYAESTNTNKSQHTKNRAKSWKKLTSVAAKLQKSQHKLTADPAKSFSPGNIALAINNSCLQTHKRQSRVFLNTQKGGVQAYSLCRLEKHSVATHSPYHENLFEGRLSSLSLAVKEQVLPLPSFLFCNTHIFAFAYYSICVRAKSRMMQVLT
jgi:hypothetical protein